MYFQAIKNRPRAIAALDVIKRSSRPGFRVLPGIDAASNPVSPPGRRSLTVAVRIGIAARVAMARRTHRCVGRLDDADFVVGQCPRARGADRPGEVRGAPY